MAPPKGKNKSAAGKGAGKENGSPPKPFRRAPEALRPFYDTLSQKHVYVAHVDNKPRAFKLKMFLVPVAMNLAVAGLFAWRLGHVGPWYLQLLASALGQANETTVRSAEATWRALALVVAGRALTFALDLALALFVWPWPVEFVAGRAHGSPAGWRWRVGFRDAEVYVRRSRSWDRALADVASPAAGSGQALLLAHARRAADPALVRDKTGYLTINGEWDLDWDQMVHAHALVDAGRLALAAFRLAVLVFHREHGWLLLDLEGEVAAEEDDRRRQVSAFRDALAAVGKEDLFFRWIEIIQFESSQPGGFGPEKQFEAAKKVRDLFEENGVDFDTFWKESVGTDSLTGM